jgi:hypothetical protein
MATLVNAGKAINAARMIANTQVAPGFIAIGSGSTAESAAQTALVTEYTTGTWTGYARVSTTGTQVTVNQTNDTAQWVATFTAPAAETVAEAGNFDASTTGNMLIRGTFTGVALASGDSIQITIKQTFQ